MWVGSKEHSMVVCWAGLRAVMKAGLKADQMVGCWVVRMVDLSAALMDRTKVAR